jgi:hypothetical protein
LIAASEKVSSGNAAQISPDRQTAEIRIRIAIMNRFSPLGRAEVEAVR